MLCAGGKTMGPAAAIQKDGFSTATVWVSGPRAFGIRIDAESEQMGWLYQSSPPYGR